MNNPHSTPGTPASTTKLLRRILLITAAVCANIFATLPHLTVLGTVRGLSLIPIAQAVLLWAALGLVVCALAALCARSFAAATILLIAAIAGVMPMLTWWCCSRWTNRSSQPWQTRRWSQPPLPANQPG